MTPQIQHQIPKASDLQAFNHAVAGHAGTLCDATGALFIKPCVQKEIDFYETVSRSHPELAQIMPLFVGTLKLQESSTAEEAVEQIRQTVANAQDKALAQTPPSQTGTESSSKPEAASASASPPAPAPAPKKNTEWIQKGSGSIDTDRAVVLENATHGYRHPNILDVKLGKRLYANGAAEKKIEHMKLISDQTTHKNFGFRIAGMRVWNGAGEDSADTETKAEAEPKNASPSIRSENGYTVYDKDYGRKEVNDDNVVDAFRRFVFNKAAGIDEEHGRAIAAAFKSDLENVRDVLEKERTCMFSSSLLFVFEGDGDALKLAIAEGNRAAAASSSRKSSVEPAVMAAPVLISDLSDLGDAMGIQIQEFQGQESPSKRRRLQSPSPVHDEPDATFDEQSEDSQQSLRASSRRVVLGKASDRSSSRTDSGIVIDDDDEQDNQTDGLDNIVSESFTIEDEANDTASTTETETSSEADLPPVCSLRLIDFAHATFVPEESGPDENNLLGVRKLIEVFGELCK
ncbi:inositol polyphosphate multikinase [Ophiostoma piceae UAMH 11346]|uniref:Kinase n=1 Tax=Ophiostoma piceae (strain UAMH 11346) TaxID=1262450 RepID=S3C4K5_OPHP1|nr:inositol polyphosphate multikinase [Ophiostoma piceae UAMH 11346]